MPVAAVTCHCQNDVRGSRRLSEVRMRSANGCADCGYRVVRSPATRARDRAPRVPRPAFQALVSMPRGRAHRAERSCTVWYVQERLLLHRFEVLHHGVHVRHLERVRSRVLSDSAALDEDLLDLHVIDHARVAPRALAEASLRVPDAGHAHAPGEKAGAIRQELRLQEAEGAGRLVLLEALLEAPLAHDEGVVHRETVDVVDAHCLDRLVVLLIPREVGGGAGGRERSGEREEHDALALEEVLCRHVLPVEGVLRLHGDARARLEDDAGHHVTLLRHRLRHD
mmetsp:Transcript_2955/g.8588  ORF Transcript_2955/g.8588 Transcript_2955/m.8588 type:complete len:282 (-) Transcript_2955:61-906(-)